MINESISKVVEGYDLNRREAKESMIEMMNGISPIKAGGFLIALRMKGESVDEITGFVDAIREIDQGFNIDGYVIDTCGTGGDGGKTFNISTAVALVAAAAGVKVAKHGNRAVSSKSGSADVLSTLGLDIEEDFETAKRSIENTGFAFFFAQKYHLAMRNIAPVRRDLGVRTVFNLLGPLTNPVKIKGQLIGVYDRKIVHLIAEVLNNLGIERAMVVHGSDGLDEITITGKTYVSELKEGIIKDYTIDPRDFGIFYANIEDIKGGDPLENATIIRSIFEGKRGPKREIVLINSAAALYTGKVAKNMREGFLMASEIVDSGLALKKLNEIIDFSRSRV
ncbi:MAG: anthranilate phosphoribosyltransferase [Athalassotoga sp.]|uniref:anthranilate phosphoribosyltransferase n=1 Tax=Athalassotoga sp. TaxID=2022597 RepID=UPI003D017B7A